MCVVFLFRRQKGTDEEPTRYLSMTDLSMNTLSIDNDFADDDIVTGHSPSITINEIKDIMMSSRSKEERMTTLYNIRSELFSYELADLGGGYSPLIAEIDRALGLLDLSPVGTADPEVLQRVDGIDPTSIP